MSLVTSLRLLLLGSVIISSTEVKFDLQTGWVIFDPLVILQGLCYASRHIDCLDSKQRTVCQHSFLRIRGGNEGTDDLNAWDVALEAAKKSVETLRDQVTNAIMQGDPNEIVKFEAMARQSENNLNRLYAMREQSQAESTGDEIKVARARQKVAEAELREAESTGDEIKAGRARYKLVDAGLELSVVIAKKELKEASKDDVDRYQRQLDFSLYALKTHRMYIGTENFFAGKS